MTYKILQNIAIVTEEEKAERIFEYLKKKYPSYDWEWDSRREIYGSDYGIVYYEGEYEAIQEGIEEKNLTSEIQEALGIEAKVFVENEGEPYERIWTGG